jgi:TDG/mug DNA glycosylase family protein
MLGPILAPALRILFVGINPSLRSAEVGHHFARPGNRSGRRSTPPASRRDCCGRTRMRSCRPTARRRGCGLQPATIGGRPVWVLPNPSGLNPHYKPADFARLYGEAREYADTLAPAAVQAGTVSGPSSGAASGPGSRGPMSSRNGG